MGEVSKNGLGCSWSVPDFADSTMMHAETVTRTTEQPGPLFLGLAALCLWVLGRVLGCRI